MNVKTNNELGEKLSKNWNNIRFTLTDTYTTGSGGTSRKYTLNTTDMKSTYRELYLRIMVRNYGYCNVVYFVGSENNMVYFGTPKDHNGYGFYGEANTNLSVVVIHTSVNSYSPDNYPLILSTVLAR